MSKKTLTEQEQGVIKKAVNAIFAAVATKKMATLQKQMMKDPKFKDSVEKLAKIRDDIEKHFAEDFKTDPHYADFKKNYDLIHKDWK